MTDRILQNTSRRITTTFTGTTLTTSGENVVYVSTFMPNPIITISTADIQAQNFPIIIQDILGNVNESNPITINCEGSEKINGETEYIIDIPYHVVELTTDGSDCYIRSRNFKEDLILTATDANPQATTTLDVAQNITFGVPQDNTNAQLFADGSGQVKKTGHYKFEVTLTVSRNPVVGLVFYFFQALIAGLGVKTTYGNLLDVAPNAEIIPEVINFRTYMAAFQPFLFKMGSSSINSGVNALRLSSQSSGALGMGTAASAELKIWREG